MRLYRFVPGVGIRCSQRGKPSFPPWESDVPPMGIHRFPPWELSGNGKGQWWTGDTPDTHLTCSLALPMVSFCPPRFMPEERGELRDSGTSCIAAVLNVHPHLTVEELSPWRLQDVLHFLNQEAPPYDWSHPSAYRQRKRQHSLSLNKVDFVQGRYFYWGATANGVVRIMCPLEV